MQERLQENGFSGEADHVATIMDSIRVDRSGSAFIRHESVLKDDAARLEQHELRRN